MQNVAQLNSTLPNITTMSDSEAGPEVFETSDVESFEELSTPVESNENITRDPLDPTSARDKFEQHAIVDSLEVVDFLGSIWGTQNGYSVRKVRETPNQRLLRIRGELEQIKLESEPGEVKELQDELHKLLQQAELPGLYQELFEDAFGRLTADITEVAESEVRLPDESKRRENSDFLELEKRVSHIEQRIGVPEVLLENSLRNHVNDLARKIDVLYDPEHDMKHMKSELKRANKELETLAANRRLALLSLDGKSEPMAIQPFHMKVDSIYSKLPEMEKVAPIVPLLTLRLRSLHQVHAELAHSVECIGQIDKNISDMDMEMKKWNESLDEVARGIKEHLSVFEQNRAAAETRLSELEARLAGLD